MLLKQGNISKAELKTLQPRDAGFSLRYIKLTAGNVLPFGSASRDCNEFCLFFDSLANPAATRLSSSKSSCGNALAVQFKKATAAYEKANRLDLRRDPGRIYEEWDELYPDWQLDT